MFLGEVAHKELLDLQSAGIPPCETNQKRVRAGAPREAGGFRVEEKPFFWIFERGAGFAGERFIALSRQQFEGRGKWIGKFRSGKPVSNGQMFAEVIPGNTSAEQPPEGILFARCANRRRPR